MSTSEPTVAVDCSRYMMGYQSGIEVGQAALEGLFGGKEVVDGLEQPATFCMMPTQRYRRYLAARLGIDRAMHPAQTSTRRPRHSFAFGHLLLALIGLQYRQRLP